MGETEESHNYKGSTLTLQGRERKPIGLTILDLANPLHTPLLNSLPPDTLTLTPTPTHRKARNYYMHGVGERGGARAVEGKGS